MIHPSHFGKAQSMSFNSMSLRKASALSLVTALLLICHVDAWSRDVKVSGMGVRKCSDWNQWKDDKNGEARATTIEWANGFFTAHNVYAPKGYEQATSIIADAKVLVPLLDAFCQKNPDSRILNGVIEITQSLGGARINISAKPSTPLGPRPDTKKERES